MKITHLSTFDVQGGAARAAYRLHQGLIKIGQNSQILSLEKTAQDNKTKQILIKKSDNNFDFISTACIQNHYLNQNKTDISNTLFSLAYPGLNLHRLSQIQTSDVINLHWVANGFVSPITIKNLLKLGKPIVWTLHDMWAFTGGCHYSAGCLGYEEECLNCPQLKTDLYNLPHVVLKDKIEFFNHPNLVIVTPSKWLAKCAKKSKVFSNNRIEIIPYSLDTNIFKSLPKLEAKQTLNFANNDIILLLGAISGNEKRKGFSELINSLIICQKNQNFARLIKENKLKITYFGEPNEQLNKLELNVIYLGKIDSDKKLSQIYSAADIFILPSLEDNFPNTMLESMSCGTPVIGFDVGGIPDLVKDGITGMIVPKNDLELMADKIIELVDNYQLRQSMSEKCPRIMVDEYSLSIQANNYLNLYQDLLANFPNQINNKKVNSNLESKINFELSVSLNNNYGLNFSKIYKDIALDSVTKELIFAQKMVRDKEEELKNTQTILEQNWRQRENAEKYLAQTQMQLDKTEKKLTQSLSELNDKQIEIEAIRNTKFWKLRKYWLKLKKMLIFNDN